MCEEIQAHALTTTAKHEFMMSVGLYYFEAMVQHGLTNIAKKQCYSMFYQSCNFSLPNKNKKLKTSVINIKRT